MSEQPQLSVPSPLELRAALEDMVVKDLRGPSLPDEEIDEGPRESQCGSHCY